MSTSFNKRATIDVITVIDVNMTYRMLGHIWRQMIFVRLSAEVKVNKILISLYRCFCNKYSNESMDYLVGVIKMEGLRIVFLRWDTLLISCRPGTLLINVNRDVLGKPNIVMLTLLKGMTETCKTRDVPLQNTGMRKEALFKRPQEESFEHHSHAYELRSSSYAT